MNRDFDFGGLRKHVQWRDRIDRETLLQLSEIAVYGKQATGEKYLINPNK